MATKPAKFQTCSCCGQTLAIENFSETNNKLYGGRLPMCNECLVELCAELGTNSNWEQADKVCQWIDIPFIPAKWQEMVEKAGNYAITAYLKFCGQGQYENIEWGEYQEEYKQVKQQGDLAAYVIPELEQKERAKLQQKWGPNYDDEELNYLEQLYNGILATQSVNGGLQDDQAIKLCKISLAIDSKIREGQDPDKLLASYEKLVKIAEFTPKNVKNAYDFDSVGEVFAYLEKTGFENKFYDGVPRDVVDVTMNEVQNFCRRLYIQESGIGENIEKRIQSLQKAKEIEDNMGLLDDYTTDEVNETVDNYIAEEFEVDI